MRPSIPATDQRIPVHVLTGFLGSGKTTFLRRLLNDPGFADTAVVINEFGEVGLDHLLVHEVAEDAILLSSGCLCCAVRDDLVSTLADMIAMIDDGVVPPFRRVVIETTGLADPAPIMQAVMSERRLIRGYRAGSIVTVVDSVSGGTSLPGFVEAEQQVALADCVILTKSDLVEPWRVDAVKMQISALNPTVPILMAGQQIAVDPGGIFDREETWQQHAPAEGKPHHAHDHSDGVNSFTVNITDDIDWPAFVDWLEVLLAVRGQSILRVKGLLPVRGESRPIVVQGVQHVVYPPEYLLEWPDRQRRGWLVFIARDLDRVAIENALPFIMTGAPMADQSAAGQPVPT